MTESTAFTSMVTAEDNSVASSPTELLKTFYKLQTERVETYGLFEQGFVAYLNGAPNYNFPLYRQLVSEITETFSKISSDIIQIKNKFEHEHNMQSISSLIDKVQAEESEKLNNTAKLQIVRQETKDHAENTEHKAEVERLNECLKSNVSKINEYLEELKYESEDWFSATCDEDDADATEVDR